MNIPEGSCLPFGSQEKADVRMWEHRTVGRTVPEPLRLQNGLDTAGWIHSITGPGSYLWTTEHKACNVLLPCTSCGKIHGLLCCKILLGGLYCTRSSPEAIMAQFLTSWTTTPNSSQRSLFKPVGSVFYDQRYVQSLNIAYIISHLRTVWSYYRKKHNNIP